VESVKIRKAGKRTSDDLRFLPVRIWLVLGLRMFSGVMFCNGVIVLETGIFRTVVLEVKKVLDAGRIRMPENGNQKQ